MGIEGKAGVRNILVGIYQATPMTLSDGELGPVQLTADGKVIVETNVDSSPTEKAHSALVKALAGTPAPIALVGSETFVTEFKVQAARADGDNTGDVFIGLITDLVSGTKNYFKLIPGASIEIVARSGTKFDLADWGIDGETATDGVIGVYVGV